MAEAAGLAHYLGDLTPLPLLFLAPLALIVAMYIFSAELANGRSTVISSRRLLARPLA